MSIISEQPKTLPQRSSSSPKEQTWKEFYDELWVRISAHQREHGITQPLSMEEALAICEAEDEE